ncbi:MAG: hypothetical protein JEZ04_11715 [Spirochaetales bacterium]|nr:hypothetical protein [Spirochaetales bacterium]
MFVEVFSIVIAFCVFIIVWNGRRYLKDNYLLLLGLAYLFIGFIDLLHVAGYKGMSIFRDYDYYANQFWIAGRGIEAVSFLSGILLISRKKTLPIASVLTVYAVVTGGLVYSILFSDIFPECFIEGEGQTSFKLMSEYVIILILLLTLFLVIKKRNRFAGNTFVYILISILFTIISEFAFMFYISNYGFSNMVGHYAKIVSFYFIYRAIIRKNILEPYDSIFRELNVKTETLDKANEMKTRLFTIISHDLTGPLAGVTGAAGTLDDNFEELSDIQRKELVSELRKAVEGTEGMIEDLLAWSKIEIGGHQLRQAVYNLEMLLEEVLRPILPSLLMKDIKLELLLKNPELLQINVDRDTFFIIIRNILSNSLKFSTSGSVIILSAETENSEVIIRIKDNGSGMNFNEEIFLNPVNSSSRGTANEKGTGLGLYMINKYMRENDGTVNIESSPGAGTTVTLTFPSPLED